MATTVKILLGFMITIYGTGCYSSKETMVLCNNKYDVYKNTEYDHEQNLMNTSNVLCFHKTNIIAFAYQISGKRNDSNLVFSMIKHQNDSLIITTYFDEKVYDYPYETHRYFKCIDNGFVSLSSNFIITKKTKQKNRLKRKLMR